MTPTAFALTVGMILAAVCTTLTPHTVMDAGDWSVAGPDSGDIVQHEDLAVVGTTLLTISSRAAGSIPERAR